MKILITSGGTLIPIDPVRRITNMSSGTFGSKLATEVLRKRHEVVFLCAEGSKTPFKATIDASTKSMSKLWGVLNELKDLHTACGNGYREYTYKTFNDYAKLLEVLVKEQPDMVILAAAVSDYGCVPAEKKIRSKEDLTIQLHALPKLISKIREWSPKTFLVGFKLLVSPADGDVIEEAKKSLVANNCDMVVANYLTDIKQGKHIVHLVDKRETISCIPDKTQNDNYCAMNVIERALLLKK